MSSQVDWKKLRKKLASLANKHARETGRAISAWNLLQDTLGRLFAEIAHPSNQKMALAIWYSQDSDRAQRNMLKAAALTAYGERAKIYKEIKWICGKADNLAANRNNVVHVGYSIEPDRLFQDVYIHARGAGSSARADKMNVRDVFDELKIVEKNSKALFSYTAELAPIVAYPEQHPPWTDRPSLLEAVARPTPNQENPPRRSKSHRRQPQASGG